MAVADYRVYRLAAQDRTSGERRIIISTLDHIQYQDYYNLQANEDLYYLDSWKCYGNFSHYAPPCPDPTPSPDSQEGSPTKGENVSTREPAGGNSAP